MKYILYIFLTFIVFEINGQLIFEQDIVQGGVTGAGFSTGQGFGSGSLEIFIEPGSTIKKAYLLTYRIGFPPKPEFILNNDTIIFDTLNELSSFSHKNIHASPVKVYFEDYTDKIDPNITNYNVEIPTQLGLPINWGYWTIYMLVIYENSSLNNTSYQIMINTQDLVGKETYPFSNLNQTTPFSAIGLSLFTDRIGSMAFPLINNVFINSNYVGKLGGADTNSQLWGFASGVKGHFYYQNNNLIGLGDDTADAVVDSSDALLDISTLITPGQNSFELELVHSDYPNNTPQRTCFNIAYFLSHSTPCETFPTAIQDKIQTCKGDSIQMQVSGGNDWQWEPQKGLSCYNCAQPYFTDTVSRLYTVRIFNNDSCSKVLPVRVEVLEKPQDPIATVNPTKCSDSSGVATVQIIDNSYQYSINNGPLQGGNVFNNLFAGNHSVDVIDTNGCKSNTVITIQETYPSAFFTATPQQGDVPLDVYLYNTSVGANNFTWYIDQDTLHSVNATHIFNTEGNFNATLVVYDTYPQCADTMSVNIFAEYPFTIFAPSLQENKKGNYQVYASGVKSLSYYLYNTLGQIIYTKELENLQGYQDLWSAYTVAKGTYLYKIIAIGENGEEKVVSGKVVVI